MEEKSIGEGELESVLCLKNSQGELVGFFRNDIKARARKMYLCHEASLEEIQQTLKDLVRDSNYVKKS